MKKILKYLLSILLIFTVSYCLDGQDKIRIACIGNSITYGYGVKNRVKNSFPSQLQLMLGEKYCVRNFGHNGATLLAKGGIPYIYTKDYKNALKFKPDVVFIELGTNDSKLRNRKYLGEFENNYTELILDFRSLPSKPKIILLLPIPGFRSGDSINITPPVIADKIIPLIQDVAYKTGCEVIDLYHIFLDKSTMVPDKVHPSSIGQSYIAKRLYEYISSTGDSSFNLIGTLGLSGTEFNYYGYKGLDFKQDNVNCKVVIPKFSAPGHPWIWRARFWGHEPQTEIALLERGFHVVYCDVADLFGNEEAVGRWNRFYSMVTAGGLSDKVVLEGMSRGGLIIYNWAAENPDKVACIYADNPVLDIKSWPGGYGKSPVSINDWKLAKEAFELITDYEVSVFKGNPVDKVTQILSGGYPMLHVCGDADEAVPYDENTGLFEKKILEAGGSITVIHKPGVGHHPHSLQNPEPIVDFILKATGYR
jgi:lysophospholipase L1-like esterase